MPTVLKDYAPSDFLIPNVHMKFELSEVASNVTSTYTVKRKNKFSTTPLVLNGGEFELIEIQLNGKKLTPADYKIENKNLTLLKTPSEDFTLEIVTRINPKNNTELSGLYLTGDTLTTQCEAEGFRNMTYFLDRPDVLAVYTTEIHADKKKFPVLLASGEITKQGVNLQNPKRHFIEYRDAIPKPSYLFAMVAGNLALREDFFVTRSWKEVALRIYVPEQDLDKTEHAMEALKAAMKFDQDEYDREYDLPVYNIVGIPQFNAGAMENKGLNIFNNSALLAHPKTTTDKVFEWVYSVVGHEYFHNWRGNRVTVKNWFQLSLKEGFATITEQEFAQTLLKSKVSRISDIKALQLRQFAQDARPLAHPVMPKEYESTENLYTMTIYLKGAELLNMLKSLLGKETFKKGCSIYFAKHDGEAANIEDFVAAMEEASGRDLSQFLTWYEQAGTPELEFEEKYDEKAQTYQLTVKQSCPPTPGQPDKKPLLIPINVGLFDKKGQEMELQLAGEAKQQGTIRTLELTGPSQTYTFTNVKEKPIPSLLRNFSAPVKIARSPITDDDNIFLLSYETDPINRWFAAQNLAKKSIIEMAAQIKEGKTPIANSKVINAFLNVLKDESLDPRLKAELLSIPPVEFFFDFIKPNDPDLINQARQTFINEFTRLGLDPLIGNYLQSAMKAKGATTSNSYDLEGAGHRLLRNVCLNYLMKTDSNVGPMFCKQQLREAKNMTDTLGALMPLATIYNNNRPELRRAELRQQALAKFRYQWKHDDLVISEYFRAFAMSDAPDALEQIIQITKTPRLFKKDNPHHVLYLVRVFFMMNPVVFHHASGKAYEFITDLIIELDQINPSTASDLVPSLASWKNFEPVRQEKMLAQLLRLDAVENLSKATKELVTKSLVGVERKPKLVEEKAVQPVKTQQSAAFFNPKKRRNTDANEAGKVQKLSPEAKQAEQLPESKPANPGKRKPTVLQHSTFSDAKRMHLRSDNKSSLEQTPKLVSPVR